MFDEVSRNCISNGSYNDIEDDSCYEEDYYEDKSVFAGPRHLEVIEGLKDVPNQNWRTKERMKTMSVAIVMCLNVGVDPPDIVKPNPCAVMQCWTDPFSSPSAKAAETIATKLIKQYERWQSRARYKHCIDPTVEDVKKLCTSLRRTSKEERVLFHYNGHGVPKPTINGEIWVFNRSFTQYIPLSLYDLQQWMGSPSIYVFDCSNAGVIIDLFLQFAAQHQKEYEMNANNNAYLAKENDPKAPPPPKYQNCILLAACNKGETLPLHPDLPADLFTSCLTTPIKTFLVWFMKQNARKLAPNCSIDLIDKIPGNLTDRKSILGELNWIFTAITDTIAWNTLPRDLFQRLFRQDLLVASLFRNFLLAQRIMRSYDCTPLSHPFVKSVHHHPMWNSWDLAVDNCLSQLAQADAANENRNVTIPYVHSQFFTEQLTAFQVWLKLSSYPQSTPEQLPIVLQVLLSQVHRSRALDLLGNFLNLGPWAVNLALSVGIFPYVLKLLQASARELRPFLVFIWAKILAIDESYQSELVRENAHRYFMNVLSDSNISISHQVMSAFVLSVIVRHNPSGQSIVVQNGGGNSNGSIIEIATYLLMEHQHQYPNLRKWLTICLGNVWENNEEIRWLATRNAVYEKLYYFLDDPVPEVRAATVYALGTFMNSISQRNEHANEIDRNIASTLVQKLFYDSSPLVRKELIVTLHWFIIIFEKIFLAQIRKKASEEQLQHQLHLNRDQSPQNSLVSNHQSIPSIVMNSTQNANVNHTSVQLTPPNSNSMKRVNSANSLSSYSLNQSFSNSISCTNLSKSKAITNVYCRVWQLIELYKLDPYPEVNKMAYIIHNEMTAKAFMSKDANSESSLSEPASPNNRNSFLSGDSPITASSNSADFNKSNWRTSSTSKENSNSSSNNKHHSGRVSVSAISSPYLPHSNNYNSFVTQYSMKRTIFGRDPTPEENNDKLKNGTIDINKESICPRSSSMNESSLICRKPLIGTAFVDWCTKHFSQPCLHSGVYDCTNIEYSYNKHDLAGEWRCNLLKKHYTKSKNELEIHHPKQNGNFSPKQIKNYKARMLAFHPFEKCLVFADRYTFSLWNYGSENGETTTTYSNDNSEFAKITDLQLVNTHDKALLMIASDDGSVKVWRDVCPPTFCDLVYEDYDDNNSYPKLSTAFFIFEDKPLRPSDRNSFLVLAWNQRKQSLIAGGDNKFIRIWDAGKEKKVHDIVTGTEIVTSLCTDYNHLICAGCEDGSVRIFDDRNITTDKPAFAFNDCNGSIVNCKIWPESYTDSIHIVSGNRSGDVRWYDKRFTAKAVRSESMGLPMTAMNFHNQTDVFACSYGTEINHEIQMYTLDTLKGPTIRLRNRTIKDLAFHNLKTKLAIATSDSTVAIIKSSLHNPGVYNF